MATLNDLKEVLVQKSEEYEEEFQSRPPLRDLLISSIAKARDEINGGVEGPDRFVELTRLLFLTEGAMFGYSVSDMVDFLEDSSDTKPVLI